MNAIDRAWVTAQQNGLVDPATGLHVRDRGDCGIVLEQREWRYIAGRDYSGAVALDLGAHIGAAAHFMLGLGVGKVVCVEPYGGSLELLRRNWSSDARVVIVPAAVTSDPTATQATLHLSRTYPAAHTVRDTRGREQVRVPAVQLKDLLRQHRPALVKCDIEGAEYGLDWGCLPECCTEVCMEYHYFKSGDLDAQLAVDAQLRGMGFRHLHPPADRVTFRRVSTAAYTRR